MTHEEKIQYMRIACGISGFSLQEKHLDILVSTYECIIENKGNTKLDQMVKIETEVEKREEIRRKKKVLDDVTKPLN